MQATKLDNLNAFPYVRAALVGYGAKNQNGGITRAGTGACSQLYRQCPSEPHQLLNYINNHNGGLVNQVSVTNQDLLSQILGIALLVSKMTSRNGPLQYSVVAIVHCCIFDSFC